MAARIYWLTEKALLEYHEPHSAYQQPWLTLLIKLMRNEYSVQVVQERLIPKLTSVIKKSEDMYDRKSMKGTWLMFIHSDSLL